MIKSLTIILALISSLALQAQKEDYNWVLGDVLDSDSLFKAVVLNFNTSPVSINYINKGLGIFLVTNSISDSTGALKCFSNGVHIYNEQFEVIEQGADIAPPFRHGTQGMLLLPIEHNRYMVISGSRVPFYLNSGLLTSGLSPCYYHDITFDSDNENGKASEKKYFEIQDTVCPHGLAAVRHGNGRDWWFISKKEDSNEYIIQLIEKGIPVEYKKEYVGDATRNGWDQAVFTPDGKKYIRYSWWGTTSNPHSSVYIYDFDRCSGTLSNFRYKELDDHGPGGAAVSPNSTYLYVSNWDTIFQYDLHASNIFSTEKIVASYDGYFGEDSYPVRFFTMQLAPDNRIYISVPNVSSRYLHYIEYPDSAGIACNVVQHGLKLPVYNSNVLPNPPNYRLFNEAGSLCDTIRPTLKYGNEVLLLPNPGNDSRLMVNNDGLSIDGFFRLFSMSGALVLESPIPKETTEIPLNTAILSQGMYIYEIWSNNQILGRGKWVKIN